MFYGVGEYLLIAAAVALVLHSLIRDFWVAGLGSAALSAVLNLAHETWVADLRVNIAWAPFILAAGFAFAMPVTLGVGLPFLVARRHRRVEA